MKNNECRVQTTDGIQTKRLAWFSHTQRMPENVVPKKVIAWTAQGRRGNWRYSEGRDAREKTTRTSMVRQRGGTGSLMK